MRLNRYRLRALARPARRWVTGLALAGLTFTIVHGAVARAEAAQARWGTPRTVLVARRGLAPGDPLDAAALRTEERPAALVADDALDADAVAAGATLALPVLAGDVVRRAHLQADGRRVPPGRRAVAVPRPVGLDLRVGDRVDVIDGAQGSVAASAAPVLRVGPADDAVVVAVATVDVGAVARALGTGRTLLVISGDG